MFKSGFTASIYRPWKTLIKDEDYQIVSDDILRINPVAVGFSVWCQSLPHALLLAGKLKKQSPDIFILFGGPQATILDKEILKKFDHVDYILRGEADETLPELLNILLSGNGYEDLKCIKGLSFRIPEKKQKIYSHEEAGYVEDLNRLPVPSYEKIFMKENVRLDVGRGCPYQCTYCTTNQFFARSYRVKSTGRIMEEINYTRKKLEINNFGFSHDTLTVDKKFINNLCDRLILEVKDKKEAITWTCSSRTDCLTEDMLDKMWHGGCRVLFLGIESGSDKIQQIIKKNLDLEYALGIVQYAINLGMQVTVSYILGFPEETAEDINKTINSIVKMVLLGAEPQVSLLSILPGTPLFGQYAGDLEYDGKTFGFTGSSLTEPVIELVKKDRRLFSSFYYLPNKNLKRTDLVFLSNLINFLPHFMPTIQSIEDHLTRDIERISLFSYISKTAPAYTENDTLQYPELIYLTDLIKSYLEYLIYKGLKPYVLDLFMADCTKAFVQVKYSYWQHAKASLNRGPEKAGEIRNEDNIRVIPVWELISTDHNVYHLSNCYYKIPGHVKIRKGKYKYLVNSVSDKYCKLIKIEGRLVKLLENLEDMPVDKFFRICQSVLDEKSSRQLLRKLIRLNMIEICPGEI